MLNWRRDPAREMRMKQLESDIEQLKNERVQIEKGTERIEKQIALFDWMHSELDLIEADLPFSSSPPPTIAANSSDC